VGRQFFFRVRRSRRTLSSFFPSAGTSLSPSVASEMVRRFLRHAQSPGFSPFFPFPPTAKVVVFLLWEIGWSTILSGIKRLPYPFVFFSWDDSPWRLPFLERRLFSSPYLSAIVQATPPTRYSLLFILVFVRGLFIIKRYLLLELQR